MRAIIIEDEYNVRAGFVKLLRVFCPEVTIVGEADRVEAGLELIEKTEFELLFLDVNLPDGSGFDLVHRLPRRDFQLIFVTAYDTYAVDAFRLSAIDYLLKPVAPDQLKRAVEKARIQIPQQPQVDLDRVKLVQEQLGRGPDLANKIILKDQDSIHLVRVGDILYCQAEGSYTRFVLAEGQCIITSLNLKEYEQLLTPYRFLRSHHSFLVNLHQIRELKKVDGGSLLMMNGEQLPISTRKKAVIMEEIKKLFIN